MFSPHSSHAVFNADIFRAFPKALFERDLPFPNASANSRARAAWADQCLRRLRELRPDDAVPILCAKVDEISHDLCGFDPVLAAEMEHECWD